MTHHIALTKISSWTLGSAVLAAVVIAVWCAGLPTLPMGLVKKLLANALLMCGPLLMLVPAMKGWSFKTTVAWLFMIAWVAPAILMFVL